MEDMLPSINRKDKQGKWLTGTVGFAIFQAVLTGIVALVMEQVFTVETEARDEETGFHPGKGRFLRGMVPRTRREADGSRHDSDAGGFL